MCSTIPCCGFIRLTAADQQPWPVGWDFMPLIAGVRWFVWGLWGLLSDLFLTVSHLHVNRVFTFCLPAPHVGFSARAPYYAQVSADAQLELAFGESGVWDAILLLLFDRLYRVSVVYSLLPLTETRQSEQAFNHVRAAIYSLIFHTPTRSTTFGYFFYLLQPVFLVGWVFFFTLFLASGL